MRSCLSCAVRRIAPVVSAVLLVSCATPRHTNTLIFGTSTRVALDVSQDATGAVGVTLGYKRYEAVWMPLFANKSQTGNDDLVPAECTGEGCRFIGKTGSGEGPAAPGAEDTYSVLATFAGQAAGGAGGSTANAQANATLAQYFATGLAARLLAYRGGAALVNTQAATPEIQELASGILSDQGAKKQKIVNYLASGGTVDKSKLETLLGREPAASKISSGQKDELRKATTVVALRERLDKAGFYSLAGPLHDSIP